MRACVCVYACVCVCVRMHILVCMCGGVNVRVLTCLVYVSGGACRLDAFQSDIRLLTVA